MRTDKITSFDFSFGQLFKMGLAAGFGLFGGAQLISGYWILGLVSCGLGAVFASDSLVFFKGLMNKPTSTPKPTNTNQDNKKGDLTNDQINDLVKKQKEKDPSPKPVSFSDTKQINQSEPRHKGVPTLNFPTKPGYTPLATSESGGSTPNSGELSRKKRGQRLSQKPTAEEMQTVRAMTEDEVEELAARPSPKQTEKKQVTRKTIPKK